MSFSVMPVIARVFPQYTKEDFLNVYRGGANRFFKFKVAPLRGHEANLLGFAYQFRTLLKTSETLKFLLEALIPEGELRNKFYLDLMLLKALDPDQVIVFSVPESLLFEDSIESYLGENLLRFKERGILGRAFDGESDVRPLFDASLWAGRVWPDHLVSFSIAGIEFNPDLPEANFYTYATHIAALFNCPVLMAALADSPADYLRQDVSNFYGILDGLTALHHAARALSLESLMKLLEIFGLEAFKILDKNGNTFLHALACSKNSGELAARQISILKTIVKLFFSLERDLEKREKFYQHCNKFGDTALNIAANRGNKELVTDLVFLPGAKTEAKSSANPKGIDFGALGIDYGTLLARKHAIFGEYMMTLEESVFSLREEGELQREAMRSMAEALEASERRQALLEDALTLSEQNQFLLMQMMQSLCRDLSARGFIGPDFGRLAAPFLALRDLAGAGAGAGAEEETGPDHE